MDQPQFDTGRRGARVRRNLNPYFERVVGDYQAIASLYVKNAKQILAIPVLAPTA